jgi:spectinomycin phosphotransferase
MSLSEDVEKRGAQKEQIMDEPPANLPDDTVATGLRTHYGLAVTTITLLPLGHDTAAWVYRVQTVDDTAYFLKVRTSVTNAPSLLVPRYPQEHGVAQVIAPLATTGASWAEVAGYNLILYPFVAGTTGMAHGMTSPQWIAYGAILRQIHTAPITAELAHRMRQDTFVPAGATTVRAVDALLSGRAVADPVAQDLATLWHERWDTVQTLVARAEELGRDLAQSAPPSVLCHADIHTNNVLLDADGEVWIVDWDETVLAPKERDLMFVVGGGLKRTVVGPQEEELFFQGYGATTIDPLALTYYRYALAVKDTGEYSDEIFLRADLGPLTRRASADRYGRMFEPSRIVEVAFASDGGIA